MELDTYLLTWNPRRWHWEELEELARQTAAGGPVDLTWSSGNTKSIVSGDRVFLFRCGKDPRGILAAGWAASDCYEGPHWDETLADQGVTKNVIDVRFDRILNPESDEILALERPRAGQLSLVPWTNPNDILMPDDRRWYVPGGITASSGAAVAFRPWA